MEPSLPATGALAPDSLTIESAGAEPNLCRDLSPVAPERTCAGANVKCASSRHAASRG
jgi:hypothetical protein